MPNVSALLQSWVSANVRVVPVAERGREASTLAARCIADAAMAGILVDDLENAAGADLLSYMGEAIDAATMREVDRLLERVRPRDAT